MLESKEKYKILVMAILLAGACYFTYYFHVVRETGTIFTHYFYIPIILAALWWRRKGLSVAIFLALLILFSHIFVREEVVTANDYFRVLMFIVIAFVVVTLSERIAKAQEKSDHLNAILGAIRNVNQLIVREKDRDRLIQRTCENLIETRGYYSAWIALVDENSGFLTAAEAGLGESFSPLVEMMKRGEFTRCGQSVLNQSGIMIVKDVAAECADCPLASTYSGRAGMAVCLEYRDRLYGILSVSIPAEMAADADEQSLFNEVAGDIALALRDIELEEARKLAEEALRELNVELEERVKKRTAELVIANEQTKKLQKRLQLQIDRMPIGLIVWDTKFRAKTWNPAATKIFGFAEEEALGKHPYELIVPKEAQPHVDNIWRRLLEGDETAHSVNENITKDGRTIICEWSNTPLKEADGTVVGVLSMAQDITERKHAEEELKHLNSVLKAIRNVNQLIIVEKDRGSLLQKACDVLIEARGYDAAWFGPLENGDIIGKVVSSGFGKDVSLFGEQVMGGDRPSCIRNALAREEMLALVDKSEECGDCSFKDAHADKEAAIIRVKHGGRLFGLLAVSFSPDVAVDEEEMGLLKEVASDIAFTLHGMELEETRKRAEESLRQSEKRYRTLMEGAGQPIFTMNRDSVFCFMNETAADSLGGQPDDFVGKTMWDIFPKDIAELQMSNITRAIESGESLEIESESVIQGERCWYDARIHPLRNIAGEIDSALVITLDITQRKKAEERISRFSRIFEDSLNEIYLFKTDTLKFTQVNRAAQQNLGYTMEELQKMTPLDFKPEFTTESFAKLVAPLLKGETKKIVFETVHKRKDQSLYEVEVHLQLLKYEHETLFAAIILDITERKQAEEDLKHLTHSLQEHAEKLEEAKKKITVAYRLREHFLKETSHRIITPVAIIGGHADLLLESSNLDEAQKEKIRIIRERNEEVQKLVRDALVGKYLKEEKEEGGEK